ncbi:MAG: 30S ribosomal protein S3 [Gammaproteobacteria bacterium RIFCSPHIGHO2_12_FULL_37_34]|nr:MAG: 30S ribosomal protein S3 [Gammaproteobacteria bacterium RIFCSPHIGHO2_12_FULL_37_34]
MGQKVNPVGIRLGIVKDWASRWYASSKEFSDTLYADLQVRKYLSKKLAQAGISRIQIDRPARNAKVTIYTARPGVIIGKSGKEVETLRNEINSIVGVPVHVSIEEVRKPEIDAKLVAESVAQQLERRIMFRRAMKRAVTTALRAGALGIKISVSGRLGGSEIARTEWYREGRVPLQTFRADIDYALAEAYTTYGVIGVKVWIFKGEILGDKTSPSETTEKTGKQEK